METFTATKPKNYCFPQERPATKEELTAHIYNALNTGGRSMTHEEFTQNFEEWFKNLKKCC